MAAGMHPETEFPAEALGVHTVALAAGLIMAFYREFYAIIDFGTISKTRTKS
jgi:hypothetical protein